MKIAEVQIKVPCMKYSISVQCTKTRRLTAMEWLILTCISRFRSSTSMSNKTMKNAFESVLALQDSNLLINPCINELRKLKVIEISGDNFEYNRTRFSSLSLTPLGEEMLKNGLLPGESASLVSSVWYNPLTSQLNTQEIRKSGDTVRSFGSEELYDTEFPEHLIKQSLQDGLVSSERFVASEYVIDSIKNIETHKAESVITLIAEVDGNNCFSLTPDITNNSMKGKIKDLLIPEGLSDGILKDLVSKDEITIDTVYGSGGSIVKAIFDVCRNSHFLFIDGKLYDFLVQYHPEYVSGKTVVVYNSDRLDAKEDNDQKILFVPFSFSVSGCVLINEKNQSVSLCRSKSEYKGTSIIYPLAVRDTRINKSTGTVIDWFDKELIKASKKDIGYICAYGLPIMTGIDSYIKVLNNEWKSKNLNAVLSDIKRIASMSTRISGSFPDIGALKDLLVSKLNYKTESLFVSDSQKLVSSGCVVIGSPFHHELVHNAVSALKNKPVTYEELLKMQDSFAISSHETALLFDDIFDPLYDVNIVKDFLRQLMDGRYFIGREFFSMDAFFNSYAEIIKEVEFLISEVDLFHNQVIKELRSNVINCPDLALLQTCVSELVAKNAEMVKLKMNMYQLMQSIDQKKADFFYRNLSLIERFINEKMNGILPSDESMDPVPGNIEQVNETVYIPDTCALINNKDLFQYFKITDYIRIPIQVIDELGRVKDKRSSVVGGQDNSSQTARCLVKDINLYLKIFNKMNECIFLSDRADLDLLPADLNRSTPDNIIFSTALKYKAWNVVLITDDTQFALLAKQYGVTTITGNDFIKSHKSSYCDKKYLEEKYMSADEPSASVLKWISEHPQTFNIS